MKPILLQPHWTHIGICEHHAKTSPDQIVIIESTLFGVDQTHVGFWIGRYAEAPWDVLAVDDPSFRWHTCNMPMRN